MGYPKQTELGIYLDIYAYLDHVGVPDGTSLADAMDIIASDPRVLDVNGDIEGSKEFRDNYFVLRDAVERDPYLAGLIIQNQTDHMDKPFYDVHASTFVSPDGKDVFVAFRGTGDGRWINNAEGMSSTGSYVQLAAVDYFEFIFKENGWGDGTNLTLTGHSMGGNLAQYITMTSEHREYVDRCLSIDGPQHSPEAIAAISQLPDYETQRDKIWNISGENDPVNQLGKRIVKPEHEFYIDQSDVEPSYNGLNIFDYHIILSLLDENGKVKGRVDEPGEVGKLSRRVSDIIMEMPPDERRDVMTGVMEIVEVIIGNVDISTAQADNEILNGLDVLLSTIVLDRISPDGITSEQLCEIIMKHYNKKDFYKDIGRTSAVLMVCFSCPIPGLAPIIIKRLEELERKFKDSLDMEGWEGIIVLDRVKDAVSKLVELIKEVINDLKEWYQRTFKRGYNLALGHPELYIDTAAFENYGKRLEALYNKIRDVEDLLDNVYWWSSLSLPELNAVGNAVRRTGSLRTIKRCASYFSKTAKEFDQAENELKI